MNKKLLFFDIDGTLIDNTRGISEVPKGVKKELARLQKVGHKLLICSGRPKAMLQSWIFELGFDGYVLANGGYVEINGKSIYEERMDEGLLKKTITLLKELGCEYMLETACNIYLDRSFCELYDFFTQYGFEDIFVREFDEESVIKETIKIEINVLNEQKEQVENAINDSFGYVISYDQHGTDNAFELYSPTLSKAVGIQKVLDYFHVCKEDTYAFGDGSNDIEMLKFCGTGVAMGNAVQSLKDVADIICNPIDENGLEEILKQLFPSGSLEEL